MPEKLTIKQLATGTAGPRWVHLIGYGLAIVAAALPLWQQVDETFAFTTNYALEESRRHFDETPIEAGITVPGIGMVTLQYFESDRCVRVFREDMDTAKWVTFNDFQAVRDEGALSLFVAELLAAPTCVAAEAREDTPTTKLGERQEEMVQVHYLFADGCEGWSWCHLSGSYCETHKDGTLKVQWERCVH